MRAWFWLFLLLAAPLSAVEPYFAAPRPVGQIDVDLHAAGGVTAGTPVIASFGVPFPRGSITPAGLATLRVLDGDVEIPAFVSALTPWRHRVDPALDGQSVRVALVQVELSFANPAQPKRLSVAWGGAPRTQSRPTRATRAQTWQPVQGGSFTVADAVLEPRVIATLPATWLSLGALRTTRTLPFDPSNGAGRDDPAAMRAIASWSGTQEAERAMKNNFYTVINEDDPAVTTANQCPFRTAFEPWLYDRPATMFALYLKSANPKALREAIRNAEFYRARLSTAGAFSLNPGDNKYSFNESLAYAYWLTGDETFLPAIAAAASAHDSTRHAWSSSLGFWTERSVAFKLEAYAIDYEVHGTPARRNAIAEILGSLAAHQGGTLAGIPSPRVDGGWYHTGAQHGDWDEAAYGGSTWMTALLSDALRRAYLTGEEPAIAQMIRRSGTFLRQSIRSASSQYGGTLPAPRYVIRHDGNDFPNTTPIHDEEHALDVAAALAWADYFGALLGQRDPQLAQQVTALYGTYDLGVNFWIRPAAPASGLSAFRVNPWRKWGWEHATSDGLSFAQRAVRVTRHAGTYWNPQESGHGVFVVQAADTLIPAWYTYDTDGKPLWFLVSGATLQADGSYAGGVFRYTGAPFNQSPPDAVQTTIPVGNARFRFASSGAMEFQYTIDNRMQTRTLVPFDTTPAIHCPAS
ncbi:MAG: hypothetical protein MUE46_18340 [Xanthomonadales bacterium]|jgi:hypothetical protein|nr:hypothetical protein [Xanthomonadales bacterium]